MTVSPRWLLAATTHESAMQQPTWLAPQDSGEEPAKQQLLAWK